MVDLWSITSSEAEPEDNGVTTVNHKSLLYSSIWLVLAVISGLNCKLVGNITSCGTWNSYNFLSVYGPTSYYRNKGNVLRYVTGSSVVL